MVHGVGAVPLVPSGIIARLGQERAGGCRTQSCGSIADLSGRLDAFHRRLSKFFVTRTRSLFKQSKGYLCGLMQAERKNMERISEVVPGCNDQAYQHFLSNSPWSHREVLDQIALDVDAQFDGSPDTCFVVDESGFAKKGDESAGVARQWLGSLGKTDNGQVGVFGGLACEGEVALTDCALYLSKAWVKDRARCERAGIPQSARVFQSKAQQALGMVRHARLLKVRFSWVSADAGYGKEPWWLRALEQEGEVFCADVHCDQRIYLEDPQPVVPQRRGRKGKTPTRLVAQSQPVRVDRFVAGQPTAAWDRVPIRDTTKGQLVVEVLPRRVWLWDGKEPKAHCWHLIARREVSSSKKIKYTLSNAPAETPIGRLAFMQAQRYWIEHALRNGKSEAGMDHYQVRLWQGWHHHMTMVMLAMLFMFEVRRETKEAMPLLSCHDVVEILKVILPRANVTRNEIAAHIEERHRRRQSSIDSAYRRQARMQQYSEH